MSINHRLITLADTRSPAAEAFRTLRTNLQFLSPDQPLRTLLVTSAANEDGKGQVLANLAVTFAQGGRSTLLVDCDLRRPCLHELFGLPVQPGLSDALLDQAAEPALLPAGVENLWLLPAGRQPPNPADLLGSRGMEDLIARLQARADYVLFAAPPVLTFTDAALLSVKLDAVLLVVNAGRTRRDDAQRVKDRLERVHARLAGVVLANAAVDRGLARY
jgi:non-specific protein-tyrosine kinase